MDWRAAESRVRTALAISPDDPREIADLGLALLGQGRWGEGFQLLEARRRIPERAAKTDLPYARWQGEPLDGKSFLILAEDGYGDQIMMGRFARRLADLRANVTWLCERPVARLFAECLGISTVVAEGQITVTRPFDFYAPSMSLASLFMPPLQAPPGAPYLTPPPAKVVAGYSIGVATRGNPKHVNDAARSLSPDLAEQLTALPGALSLLPEDTGARDFYDTATLIAGLDLVISVDTSVAHLAASMGKPTWILIPSRAPDWRWLSDGVCSPWYPSATLYRQGPDFSWAPVVAQALRDAEQFRSRRTCRLK